MPQVDNIDRTQSDLGDLVHENYQNEVKPLLKHIDPMAALFTEMGSGGYSLDGSGEKLVGSLDDQFAGGFMGTGGHLPDHQDHKPFPWETTPTRLYARRAIDNFAEVIAQRPGAFEDLMPRITKQMIDAVERGTARHIHGSSDGTVATFVSRSDADTLVVDAGYGHAGQDPTLFIDIGDTLALLNANNSFAVIGVARISDITRDSPQVGQATLDFATDIDTGSDGEDGDPLVFATTNDSSASYFETERNNAPNGLLDMIDPSNDLSAFMGVTEADHPRWNPIRATSNDLGQVEIMEFLEQISSRANTEVTPETHVLTCQNGVRIELAKDLLPYQQMDQLGRTLEGGWQAVKIGGFDFVASTYHVWDMLYAINPEYVHVIDMGGQAGVWAGDGSKFSRLPNYDGKEWFFRHYVQRITTKRNCLGALTGVPNPNRTNYLPVAA